MLRVFIQAVVSLHTVILCAVVGMRLLAPVVTEERPHLLLQALSGPADAPENNIVLYDIVFRQSAPLIEGILRSAPENGRYILYWNDGMFLLYHVSSGEQTTVDLQQSADMVWSHNGTGIAYYADDRVWLFDTETLTRTPVSPINTPAKRIFWLPDDEEIVFLSHVRIEWRTATGETFPVRADDHAQYRFGGHMTREMELSPDGTHIAYVVSSSQRLMLVDVETMEVTQLYNPLSNSRIDD
ncbi:MAG: hypothetical protein AAF787_16435, partial [Chloroflexota bacterium]